MNKYQEVIVFIQLLEAIALITFTFRLNYLIYSITLFNRLGDSDLGDFEQTPAL